MSETPEGKEVNLDRFIKILKLLKSNKPAEEAMSIMKSWLHSAIKHRNQTLIHTLIVVAEVAPAQGWEDEKEPAVSFIRNAQKELAEKKEHLAKMHQYFSPDDVQNPNKCESCGHIVPLGQMFVGRRRLCRSCHPWVVSRHFQSFESGDITRYVKLI